MTGSLVLEQYDAALESVVHSTAASAGSLRKLVVSSFKFYLFHRLNVSCYWPTITYRNRPSRRSNRKLYLGFYSFWQDYICD